LNAHNGNLKNSDQLKTNENAQLQFQEINSQNQTLNQELESLKCLEELSKAESKLLFHFRFLNAMENLNKTKFLKLQTLHFKYNSS
jgi:hypothetical protein